MQARDDEVAALREQAVQRTREAAEFGQAPRFMEVDPGNRLVADVLEGEWNQRLLAQRDAEDERDRLRREDRIALDESVRHRVLDLATDFPRLWNNPATPSREKKTHGPVADRGRHVDPPRRSCPCRRALAWRRDP